MFFCCAFVLKPYHRKTIYLFYPYHYWASFESHLKLSDATIRMRSVKQWVTSLGTVILRRVPGTLYFVSKCGQHYSNLCTPHIVTTIGRNIYLKYLSCGTDHHMHKLVGRAWVYNPCPSKFRWIDHIDGDRQNNQASNLRWVSPSLNGLNKQRSEYAKKETRKYKSGKVGVFYRGRVTLEGRSSSISYGNRTECEKACKQLINDTWISQYNKDITTNEKPARAYYLSYWEDYHTTPVMRPGFIDTPAKRAPNPRTPQFVL